MQDVAMTEEDDTLARKMFDEAQRQVHDLIETDAFPRFVQSVKLQS